MSESEQQQALAIPDQQTEAIQKPETKVIDFYLGASSKPCSPKQIEILMEAVDPQTIEIRPDGIIYMPQTFYRRRLNRAFGPGGWAVVPKGELSMKANFLYRPYALFCAGRFISEAIGSQEYFESNSTMNFADAAEGVKSNAIERCCKDLGIASELWDKGWIESWISSYAIQVTAYVKGQSRKLWRRKDRNPLPGEQQAKAPQATQQPQQAPIQTEATTEDLPWDIPEPVSTPEPPPTPHIEQSDFISEPQRKRLYAIARSSGLNDIQFKEEMQKMGYSSSKEVKRTDYQDVCNFFEGMKK